MPVMILTANDTLANAIESIKLGAFHFLSKPYAAEELLSRPCLQLAHPDDREAARQQLQKLREGVPTIQFESRCRCREVA